MYIRRTTYLFFLISVIVYILLPSVTFAALRLSITPAEGGNNLRFGKSNLLSSQSKEVKLRITSTENKQYQIFQRLQNSFVNERGQILERSALECSSAVGSNSSGSLYLQDIEPVAFSEQLIYSSDSTGLSDSFTVVYRIDPSKVNYSGNFMGSLVYSIRTIGGATQQEVVMNLFLEVPDEFQIELKSSSAYERILLSTDQSKRESPYLEVTFSANMGKELEVYQELLDFPSNEKNQLLPKDAILISAEGGQRGTLESKSSHHLRFGKELIYLSRNAEDAFRLNFKMDPDVLATLSAGRYESLLRYEINSGQDKEVHDIALEIDVKPEFRIKIIQPSGGMKFVSVLPNAEPKMKEVLVKVYSNLGQAYLVRQSVKSPLANLKGIEFSNESFKMKEILADDSTGRIEYPEFKPVPKGDSVLYYSNSKGSNGEFRVLYQLEPYPLMQGGDYKTSIAYSLEAL